MYMYYVCVCVTYQCTRGDIEREGVRFRRFINREKRRRRQVGVYTGAAGSGEGKRGKERETESRNKKPISIGIFTR